MVGACLIIGHASSHKGEKDREGKGNPKTSNLAKKRNPKKRGSH